MKKLSEVKVGFLQIPISRILLLLLADMASVLVASFFSLYVRYEFKLYDIDPRFLNAIKDSYLINMLVTFFIFYLFRLYNSVWRYASDTELVNVIIASVLCSVAQPVIYFVINTYVPRSYPFYYCVFMILLCGGSRFSYRILRSLQNQRQGARSEIPGQNYMIIGAGAAGNAILNEIVSSGYLNMRVCCFIDDNPNCHGKYLHGVPIVGGRNRIKECAEKYQISDIIIAIPSASRAELKPLVEMCNETECKLKILPGMYQIINGDVNVSKLREVQIEDLLGRDPIEVNVEEIIGYVKGKVILVTGGGGSIGSELCRQIARHEPGQLLIMDIYENNAYEIQQELKRDYPNLNLVVLIGSVRNTKRVDDIFATYHPDIVYHAAAHKHVPLMEDSPNEAIKNNVFGTYKVACAADKYHVKKFVMISTDKAVNPTNIMGASKRICEMIVQKLNRQSETEFVAVRFGNVLGSNGSVVPLFKKQIEQGGPVTVTHPDIIRYFMTIPEAVSLVLQAGAYAKGGEIFVLDMGEPMKILDLARNMIRLCGYRVDEDIKIEFTGLRPGEKMYEELLMSEEGMKDTANKMIHIGKPIEFDDDKFEEQLNRLEEASMSETGDIRMLVKEMVPTYKWLQ